MAVVDQLPVFLMFSWVSTLCSTPTNVFICLVARTYVVSFKGYVVGVIVVDFWVLWRRFI